MARVDFKGLADQILTDVGGPDNVLSASHCITRLRLKLKDSSKVDKAAVEGLDGVITVVEAGGQFQVVIGDDVPKVYAEFVKDAGVGAGEPVVEDGPKANPFNQFIDMISKIFLPILWTLAGAGLLKAFLALFITLGWINPEGQNYLILNALSDSIFYFLPLFLAVTSARRFGANEFTAMAIAGALVYPQLMELADATMAGEEAHFLGIPVVMMSYASSVIPIVLAVYVQSKLESLTEKLPKVIRNFTVSMISLLVMVPLTLIVVGPVTLALSNWVADGLSALFDFAPWLGGALMGGFWQVFVMFGLHWGFIPVILTDLTTIGYSVMAGALPAAVLAQAGAGLAVLIRSRSAKRREGAGV